jgi:CheY-like chemotaxis protein
MPLLLFFSPLGPGSAALADGPPSRRRVLIVDNCPDNRDTLALLLRLWGHDCRTAPNAAEALAAARTFRPDVVLLDLVLPGPDGCAVARGLAAAPGGRRPLLVAVTGLGRPEDRRRAREAGCDALLLKPADPDELRRLVEQAPAGRG